MHFLLTIPFIVQGLAIVFDEYVFHRKRGLPRWERIGHPLDTLTVLTCLLFILLVPFTATAFKIYVVLGLFSCIFVTKDEFIHKECCPASEQWLHSVLFINHPVLLAAASLMWPFLHSNEPPYWLLRWFNEPGFFKLFLQVQTVFVALFMFYQAIYWNLIWKEPKKTENDSI